MASAFERAAGLCGRNTRKRSPNAPRRVTDAGRALPHLPEHSRERAATFLPFRQRLGRRPVSVACSSRARLDALRHVFPMPLLGHDGAPGSPTRRRNDRGRREGTTHHRRGDHAPARTVSVSPDRIASEIPPVCVDGVVRTWWVCRVQTSPQPPTFIDPRAGPAEEEGR